MIGRSCPLVACAWALVWVMPAAAETPEEIFDRGNTDYSEGRYHEAAEAYREVLRYRIEDPRVDYNLGNAEFRLGNLGRSILHLERAKRLDPTDEEILGNLDFARSFCFDRVEVPSEAALLRVAKSAQDRVGPDRQAWTALAVFWTIAALVAWCSSRPGGWSAAHGWVLAALLVALTIVTLSWYTTYERLEGRRVAVILADSVDVLAGPGRNNAALFTVHEGLTLEVRAERVEWLHVSLPNGLSGWVDRRAIEIV